MAEPRAVVSARRRAHKSYAIELQAGGLVEVDESGPRSTEIMLAGLAACSARTLDQVLARMRIEPAEVRLRVEAERAPEPPEVVTAIRMVWRLAAPGVGPDRLRHAVEVAERNCPVRLTLIRACPIETVVEL